MKLLILFIVLNIANVIIQTVKSIVTIKCGKTVASVVSAIAYGLYTIVLVYTNSDLNLWAKVAVVAGANLVGVYIVKWIEEKNQKEKLWKVEFTVKDNFEVEVAKILKEKTVSYNTRIATNNYIVFNAFCYSRAESEAVKEIVKKFNAKYFISETKYF